MTVTGVLPCWTSIMVINATESVLLMLNSQHWNNNAWSRNCLDLIDTYAREEIKVEYILDCLFAELKVQGLPDAQNILANSMLEFIWKISDHSGLYTTETYKKKLQMFGTLQSRCPSFDDFIWAFTDRDFQQVRGITNSVLFWHALPGEWGLPESAQTHRRIESMIWML